MITTAATPLASVPVKPGDLFRARWAARRARAAASAAHERPPVQHGTPAASDTRADVAGRPHDSS
jgi:hypothetical protein